MSLLDFRKKKKKPGQKYYALNFTIRRAPQGWGRKHIYVRVVRRPKAQRATRKYKTRRAQNVTRIRINLTKL